MAKPLSVWKYYRNNQKKATVVFMITFLSVFLQCALLIYTTSILNLYHGSRPEFMKSLTYVEFINPTPVYQNNIIEILRKQPAVAKIISAQRMYTSMSIIGGAWIFGIKSPEIGFLMQVLNLSLIQGQLPAPDSREVVLHWRIAANKGLKIGDHFGKEVSPNDLLEGEYLLAGLLDGKSMVGFCDLNTYNHDYQKSLLLIIPQPGHLDQMKHYLPHLAQRSPGVYPANANESYMMNLQNSVRLLIDAIYLVIAAIMTICAGFLFYLYFYQRRAELGLLEVLGHTRQMIISRTFMEIFAVNLLGFGSALVISLFCGWAINRFALQDRGLALILGEPDYFFKLFSTLLSVSFCSFVPVWRMLKKVDPISIIERTG
jgi:ABC-type lipoprotein release transport system permease subunit